MYFSLEERQNETDRQGGGIPREITLTGLICCITHPEVKHMISFSNECYQHLTFELRLWHCALLTGSRHNLKTETAELVLLQPKSQVLPCA